SGPRNDAIDEVLDRPLVQRINDGRFRHAALRADVVDNRIELRLGTSGENDAGPLPGKGPGHGTPNRPARAVDHGNLAPQQHARSPFVYVSDRTASGSRRMARW